MDTTVAPAAVRAPTAPAADAWMALTAAVSGPGRHRSTRWLPRDPRSVAVARSWLRRELAVAVPGDVVDRLALVLSEIVTNGIVHAWGPHLWVRIERCGGCVGVGVMDQGPAPELSAGPADLQAEHGRGLVLVEHECARWGWDRVGQGLLVWAVAGDAPERPGRSP